jgi:hypothetical protein
MLIELGGTRILHMGDIGHPLPAELAGKLGMWTCSWCRWADTTPSTPGRPLK